MAILNFKLVKLVKSFSNEEIREFKRLLSSPLYNPSGRNYIPLLNEIVKYDPAPDEKIYSHQLYERLYPGKKFSGQTLKNRFSELFKLGEHYLVYRNLDVRKFDREKILLEEFLTRKLYGLFTSKYKKTKKLLATLPDDDMKLANVTFLNKINLNLLTEKRNFSTMLKQYYEYATDTSCEFLISLFEIGVEYLQQDYLDIKSDFNVAKEILNNIELDDLIKTLSKSDKKIFRLTCMQYYLYMAFKNVNEEKYYQESRKIFLEYKNHFSKEFLDVQYKTYTYYCIRKQNEGNKKFQHELFKLYNEKIEEGLVEEFREKSFPTNNFRDYVFIGISVGRLDWVESLLKKYSHMLPDELREDEVNLSYGKIHFSRKKYASSLQYLFKVRGTNYLHYLDASVYKLLVYFELGNFEDAYFELDKIKHYIRNHKEIPTNHKVMNVNFVRIYQKLLRHKSQFPEKDAGYLEREINSYEFISKRDWLLAKIPA